MVYYLATLSIKVNNTKGVKINV